MMRIGPPSRNWIGVYEVRTFQQGYEIGFLATLTMVCRDRCIIKTIRDIRVSFLLAVVAKSDLHKIVGLFVVVMFLCNPSPFLSFFLSFFLPQPSVHPTNPT